MFFVLTGLLFQPYQPGGVFPRKGRPACHRSRTLYISVRSLLIFLTSQPIYNYFFNSQKWIKENVQWHNDGTMSYSTRKEFSFVPELSVGDHSKDQITLANVPAISAMYQNRYASYWNKLLIEGVLTGFLGHDMWVTRSPEQFVWGYNEPLFELAKTYMPAGSAPPSNNFGFFVDKNQSVNNASYSQFQANLY